VRAVNYTFPLFNDMSQHIAIFPIVNFHFTIVTRTPISVKTFFMFTRCFIPLVIHYFQTFITYLGEEMHL
jgi:hypothetical protein